VAQLRFVWRGKKAEILGVPDELGLINADNLAARGCAAISRCAQLLLLDLSGLSFCDARGLGALVKIANYAEAAGCRYGLVAPQSQMTKLLRITGLDQRMPVFTTLNQALTGLTARVDAAQALAT
jgi:anti-anti-sigma factor